MSLLRFLWGSPFAKQIDRKAADVAFLGSVPVFETLAARQRERLYPLLHLRRYQAGEVVFRQGDPGVGLYIIREGRVSIFREHDDLTKTPIATLGEGEFFGDVALLNESPRSGSVVADTEVLLFGFFRTDLLALIDSDPRIGVRIVHQLARIVAERLRLVTEFSE